MKLKSLLIILMVGALALAPFVLSRTGSSQSLRQPVPDGKSEVVFWHFWGGEDGKVVDDVVQRFNQSQDRYHVRAIAMPGNNLQAKLFLSVAGGDPPDLINQDDPVLADWTARGVIQPIESFAPADEVAAVKQWLFDSAYRLSTVDGQLCGLCNGLDVRALFYNRSVLEQYDLEVPSTIEDLDRISQCISPSTAGQKTGRRYCYLPDSRRLWAWGFVFGGDFYDAQSGRVILDRPEIREALGWMQGYAARYGADNLAAFRQGDQSLPGKSFPLLPTGDDSLSGRYVFLMDGQWRCRDIESFLAARRKRNVPVPEFGVCPLPCPENGGRRNSGWVNGNFFVVPRGASNPDGAWEFMKFWSGFSDPEQAAKTCAAGGWIPVSRSVVASESFEKFLNEHPLFARFVDLADSENQFPVPVIRGSALLKRSVENAAFRAMDRPDLPVQQILRETETEIREHLNRIHSRSEPAD